MAEQEEDEGRVFIDPEDGKEFTTRNLAKKHMIREGHRGAVIVTTKETPKKGKGKGTGKIAMMGKRGNTGKRISKKRKKMNRVFQLFHQYIYEGDEAPLALAKVSTEVKEPKRKILAWLDTMRGERKAFTPKGGSKVEVEEEKEKEKEPKIVSFWIRIFPQYADYLKSHLEEGMEIQVNPENQNTILKYLSPQISTIDYWMFHYNFTSVDLENSDILYILGQVNPTNNYKVWDTAEVKLWGLEDISDEGCLSVSKDDTLSLSASVIMGRLGEAVSDDLACVSGIFVDDSQSLVSIDEEHFQFASEEEEGFWQQGSHHSRWEKPKPKPQPKFIKYPVYIVSEFGFGTNRLINYEIYE